MPDYSKAIILEVEAVGVFGIPGTLEYTNGPNTGQGSTLFNGAFIIKTIAGIAGCFNENPLGGGDGGGEGPSVPPTAIDPPLPPVWPYPTGNIYQREHWDMRLDMIRGDTFKFDIIVIQNGARVNLTGATLIMTAKYNFTDADVDKVFRRDNGGTGGIVVTDAVEGEATVTLISANTSGLAAHRVDLVYDLQLVNASSEVYSVMRGSLIIRPDVTIAVV